jgi:hypothetical protein
MNLANVKILVGSLIPKSDVNIPKAELNNAQFQSLFSLVLAVAGIVAVIVIIVAGIKYSVSQGDSTEVQRAKDMILYALAGLVVVIFAFTIVQFVTANTF